MIFLHSFFMLKIRTLEKVWKSDFLISALSRIDAFLSSDQCRCASKLLSAYSEGDVEEIKRVAQSSTISHLDNAVIT